MKIAQLQDVGRSNRQKKSDTKPDLRKEVIAMNISAMGDSISEFAYISNETYCRVQIDAKISKSENLLINRRAKLSSIQGGKER